MDAFVDDRMLKQELHKLVEHSSGPQIKLKEAQNDGCHTFVLATLAHATDTALRLRSYDTVYSDALAVSIEEAAHATAAAGRLVPPVKIGRGLYVGGDTKFCNPTSEAIEETRDIWGHRSIGVVVSIGAGPISRSILSETPTAFREYISRCTHAVDLVQQDVRDRFEHKRIEGEYFRFNVPTELVPSCFGINEHERVQEIRTVTGRYMRDQMVSNRKIASLLLKQHYAEDKPQIANPPTSNDSPNAANDLLLPILQELLVTNRQLSRRIEPSRSGRRLELSSGVHQLRTGVRQLRTGVQQLRTGVHQLRTCIQRTKPLPAKILLKAISPEADKVAVLSKKMFWVFSLNEAVILNCIGEFNAKPWRPILTYLYASEDSDPTTQVPIPDTSQISDFSCTALSSAYLAIGCPGHIMTFIVVGSARGRWVTSNMFGTRGVLVERLVFSPDGQNLLSLVKMESGFKALIYSTDQFPKDSFERLKPTKPIAAAASETSLDGLHSLYRPSGAAFGWEGTMVAICTSHVASKAIIILLKKMGNGWRVWCLAKTVVCDPIDSTQLHGEGFTGISLYVHFICNCLFVVHIRTIILCCRLIRNMDLLVTVSELSHQMMDYNALNFSPFAASIRLKDKRRFLWQCHNR